MGDQKTTQTPVPAKSKPPSKPDQVSRAPEHKAGPAGDPTRKVQRRRRSDTGPSTAPATQGTDKDRPATAPRPPVVSSPGDPAEKHAEQVARKVASGGSERVAPMGGGIAGKTHRAIAASAPAPAPTRPPETTRSATAAAPSPTSALSVLTPAPAGPAPSTPAPATGTGPARGTAPAGGSGPSPAGGKDVAPTSDLARATQEPSGGEPIPQPTRGILEQRLGEDLGHVRVHRGQEADRLARDISAQAFTQGRDIWLASDASPYDVELMAHEVTHVLQGIPGTIHRAPAAAKNSNAEVTGTIVKYTAPPRGTMDFGPAMTLDFENPPTVPDFKKEFHYGKSKLTWQSSQQREAKGKDPNTKGGDQREVWLNANQNATVTAVKASKYAGGTGSKQFRGPEGEQSNFVYIGTAEEVGQAITVPTWNARDKPEFKIFQVDHKQEWQLGGDYNALDNLWLLAADVNRDSGTYVKQTIAEQVRAFVEAVAPEVETKAGGVKLTAKSVHPDQGWKVTWVGGAAPEPTKVAAKGTFSSFKKETDVWNAAATKTEPVIGSTKHVGALTEVQGALSGDPNRLLILPSETGGQVRWLTRGSDGAAPKKEAGQPAEKPTGQEAAPATPAGDSNWTVGDFQSRGTAKGKGGGSAKLQKQKLWTITSFTWHQPGVPAAPGKEVGVFKGTVFKSEGQGAAAQLMVSHDLQVPVLGREGITWGGYYDRKTVAGLREALKTFKPFSPVTFDDLDFDIAEGPAGRGRIDPPSLKILEKADIGIVLGGDLGIGVEATITGGQLSLPGPLQVTGGALTLGVGIDGITADGRLDFEIKSLATGFIEAAAALKTGGSTTFALAGELNFDTKMFDKAKLGISYVDQKWGVTGELAVDRPGKIKGIKKASATIEITDGDVKADGTFQPDIKGIESGHLGLHYNEATGPEITGDVTLGKDFPGIKSGKISATVAKPPGAEGWSLDATGTAEPDIPGVQSQINVAYKNGVFDANVTAAYSKGMMSGQLMFGATNRPISADGKPGDAPADPAAAKITAYGGGQMTVKLTPWLAGTVGVKILPNGEIELMGKVALPDTLDIFAQKKLQKELFKIGIDIPIIGVAVAGQRIGIFATIQGGAGIEASVGPGQLCQLSLEIHYNPAHEDQTTITGGAQVHVPAMAGLRLFVRGALGAGIPVVSAEAGLEVSGELGIQGEAAAAVTVNWSPTQGLDLKAEASVQAEPVFKFGIAGYVLVEADLWITTIELYSKRWQLADVTLGSGLKLGMRLPVHYHEGQPFEISASDVQFDVPKIDPEQILTDLMKRIA